jgi:hypothetical protein
VNKTYLVACGRSKATGFARARDFYTGSPTQKVLAQAEAQGRTFILSAMYGLIDPDEIMAGAYDLKLDDLTGDEKRAWASKVREQMNERGIDPRGIEYVGRAPAYASAVAYLREV